MSTPRGQVAGILHFVNAVVLAGIAAFTIRSWPQLPDRIPAHFNFDGFPDRWAERGPELAMVFAMPWIMSAVLYGVWASMGYFRRHPEHGNLPRRLQGLAPERVAPLFDAIAGVVLASVTAMLLTFGALLRGIVGVALGAAERLPALATWGGLVLIGAVVAGGAIRIIVVSRRL
jgi:hypothetical protein